ncbi:hypothetical protein SAM23877_7631 [Streptomyces ambofaciens ATCC 23877]|uniref:Uncharacterized protein n=1 Tax=Streptomyces ambofaciens (strain ATCC 23877 / 3486 / DSM 40053 / JCM 4204 / NBRC 12836 / NRRL B-2516) TaxID=278992 RepID=A0A0K2B6J1_STRA7|nr:hypothetical protein SAM23877_0038 [Streptomyces ambofaciens ATCC 23877]AKZ60672.1 hypothetical protein SAM23877_7631 [Streptomyces ambofaciens ATCC 23877]
MITATSGIGFGNPVATWALGGFVLVAAIILAYWSYKREKK